MFSRAFFLGQTSTFHAGKVDVERLQGVTSGIMFKVERERLYRVRSGIMLLSGCAARF